MPGGPDFFTDDEVISWFQETLQQIVDAGLLEDFFSALTD